MPESEAWTVVEGAGKRGLDCSGRCREARFGLWWKVPESEAWTVEEGAGKRGLDCGGRCRKARLGL